MLLGIGLSALFILMALGNVSTHRWRMTTALLVAIAGTILAFLVAFSARVPPGIDNGVVPVSVDRQFRNRVISWIITVVVLLGAMKILDSLHVSWRQWFH